ncbi:hypothetical protein D3C77_793540 [compost metagenome]
MLIPRGIAIGVKLDTWFNPSLVLAIPVFVYSGMKILISLKALRAFNEELKVRELAKHKALSEGPVNV